MSYCHIVILSYCHIIILSYCHIINRVGLQNQTNQIVKKLRRHDWWHKLRGILEASLSPQKFEKNWKNPHNPVYGFLQFVPPWSERDLSWGQTIFLYSLLSHHHIIILSCLNFIISSWQLSWPLDAGHAERHLHWGRRDRPQQQGQRPHHHLRLCVSFVKQKLIQSKYPTWQIMAKLHFTGTERNSFWYFYQFLIKISNLGQYSFDKKINKFW